MTKNGNGAIYILTNPSFPDLVKIGYADDVVKRVKELNRSECTPYAFRIYATYETSQRLTDLKLHKMIDKLNPNLRTQDNVNGKKRVREFYALSKEDAYSIFEAIAEINGLQGNLKLWNEKENRCTSKEKEVLRAGKETVQKEKKIPEYTEAFHFEGCPKEIIDLYNAMKEKVLSAFALSIEPKKRYISFKFEKNGIFDVAILRSKILVWFNVRRGQLEDQNNITRDVSKVGHWGNGDYEMSLRSTIDINELMPLITQVFELKKPE